MGTRQAVATPARSQRAGGKAKPSRPKRKKHSARAALSDRGGLARPLDTLIFLLPGIVFYSAALLFIPEGGVYAGTQVVAYYLIEVFFQLFGTTGILMPGFAVVIILLCTHAASRQPWQIEAKSVGWMYVESVLLAVPLLVVNGVLRDTSLTMTSVAETTRPWLAEATLGIGAGIYEELVFRLVLISLLVMVGADLLRLPHRATIIVAVLIAAGLFAAHHHPPLGNEGFSLPTFLFRSAAGVYLGTVFVYRGYGPAAGLHIAYNLLVMMTGL